MYRRKACQTKYFTGIEGLHEAHSLIALYVNNVNNVELFSMLLQLLDGCVIIGPVADDVNLS